MRRVVICILIIVGCSDARHDVKTEIRSRLDVMESAYVNHKNQTIADIYTDDSYLIGPSGIIASGRQEVDAYWRGENSSQINWTLEDFGVYSTLDKLLESDVYKGLIRKPPLWQNLGIQLVSDQEYVFQLGRSTLINENNQDKGGSIVNFLLVWQKVGGDYFIYIDSYIGTI